jgi:hypothetical protein
MSPPEAGTILQQPLDKFSCPVCHNEFSYKSFKFALIEGQELSYPASNTPCPKCGHPLDVIKCDQCGNGLIKGGGESVQRRSQLPLYVHKFCVQLVRNRAEPVASKSSCLVLVMTSIVILLAWMFLIGAVTLMAYSRSVP